MSAALTQDNDLPRRLFRLFPEPVLLLRAREIEYRNPAAEALFPQAEPGTAAAGLLARLGETEALPALVLDRAGERSWSISLQDLDGGCLAIFRPAPGAGAPRSRDARVAGQLRQRTASLSASLQFLCGAEDPRGEKARQFLALANREVHRIAALSDQLEFLELEQPFRPGPMDLAGLCREVADAVEDVGRDACWHFTYESALTSLLMDGDDAVLRRLLMALLSNGAKAAGEEGRFGLRLEKKAGRAVLTVWDDGPGVSQEELGTLFGGEGDANRALDPVRGAGLGLEAARRAVELHGGAILFDSRPGGGFRAAVSLPIRAAEGGLQVRTPVVRYESDKFSRVLMELSEVLPAALYEPERD